MECDPKTFLLRMNVFLSYTESDEAIAVELSRYLKVTDGLTTIMHRNLINAGDDIQATIRDWTSKSDIYLQLMSNAYFDSSERREDTALFIPKRKIIYIFKESLEHTPLYEQLDYKYCYPFIRPSTNGLGIKPINDPYWRNRDYAYSNVALGLKKEILKEKNRKLYRAGKDKRLEKNFKAIVSSYLNVFDLMFDEKRLIQNSSYLEYISPKQEVNFLSLRVLQNKTQLKSYLKSHSAHKHIYFFAPIDIFTIIKGNLKWHSSKDELIYKVQELLAELKYDHFMYLIDLSLLETQLLKNFAEVQDNNNLGDKDSHGKHYDPNNITKDLTFKTEGRARVKDDMATAKNVPITSNSFSIRNEKEENLTQNANIKMELKTLLRKAKTQQVIDLLLDISENEDKDVNILVSLLSARLHYVTNQENKGTIDTREMQIELNKINDTLVQVIDDLIK